MLYKNFRLHAKQTENEAYNHKIAAAALFVLTVFSPVLEYFVLGGKYADSLPVGAGGMVGIRVGAVFAWLLGKSGSLLIILVVLLLSLSLLVQISWLEFLNGAGRAVQNRLSALSGKVMALGKQPTEYQNRRCRYPKYTAHGKRSQEYYSQTRCLARSAAAATANPSRFPSRRRPKFRFLCLKMTNLGRRANTTSLQ